MKNTIRIFSWNVNGMRSILKKNFYEFFQEHKPDILCLQETRLGADPIEVESPGYQQFWYNAVKLGYSGTSIFTRFEPLDVRKGIGIEKHDQEGRVLTLDFENFFLVNVYTPNAQPGLKRLKYRSQEWEVEFLKYLKSLEKEKPVVLCGDLNVAHKEIDLARPKENVGNPGFTPEEREAFDNLIEAKFIDTFRKFHKEGDNYTWWSYRTRARERNVGWRIDYFLASQALEAYLLDAKIHADVMGSDHCPVSLNLDSKLFS